MSQGPSPVDLERAARAAGFIDYRSMLYERYCVKGDSIQDLCDALGIGPNRIKRHLTYWGIEIRSPGGANNVKIVMTPLLLQEIQKFGVPATALRLGCHQARLHEVLKALKP